MSAICATICPWLLEKVKGPTSEKQSDFLNCFWDQLTPVEGVKEVLQAQNRLILCEYCEQPFSTLAGKSGSTVLLSALSSAGIGWIFFLLQKSMLHCLMARVKMAEKTLKSLCCAIGC